MHDNDRDSDINAIPNNWQRQLVSSLFLLGILWLYYPGEYGKIVMNYFSPMGLSKFEVHFVFLPIVTSAVHLWLSGKESNKHYWFILCTWLIAMLFVFNPIGEPLLAIISMLPALVSYLFMDMGLVYYRADELKRAEFRKGFINFLFRSE